MKKTLLGLSSYFLFMGVALAQQAPHGDRFSLPVEDRAALRTQQMINAGFLDQEDYDKAYALLKEAGEEMEKLRETHRTQLEQMKADRKALKERIAPELEQLMTEKQRIAWHLHLEKMHTQKRMQRLQQHKKRLERMDRQQDALPENKG